MPKNKTKKTKAAMQKKGKTSAEKHSVIDEQINVLYDEISELNNRIKKLEKRL